MSKHIETFVKNRVLTITLNNPEKRNALSPEIINNLTEIFINNSENMDVKLILLKANGTAFSAGIDLDYLQQLQNNTFEENMEDSKKLANLFNTMFSYPKVIIAQINGFALAGGCGLATVCDFVIATPESKFGYTEVKIGFIPAIVSLFLLRKIGDNRSRELLLTGKIIDAQTALRYGLINDIQTIDNQDVAVHKLIQNLLVHCSSHSLEMTKKLLAQQYDLSLSDALELACQKNAMVRGSKDCRTGVQAFLDKKPHQWD